MAGNRDADTCANGALLSFTAKQVKFGIAFILNAMMLLWLLSQTRDPQTVMTFAPGMAVFATALSYIIHKICKCIFRKSTT